MGTAPHVPVWFLLEYRAAWTPKAVEENDLPAAVRAHLHAGLAAVPNSRLLFIKQPDRQEAGQQLFVVRTDEARPALYQFDLDAYDDLLALDLTAVSSDDGTFAAYRREKPLFLICTNGRRDRCCARYGLPLYDTLRQVEGIEVWQSTHIGGHRFAPVVLFLPQGVNYGHLTPGKIGAAVDAHRARQLTSLDFYRGRTYYAPPVQAADAFLRQDLALYSLEGVHLQTAEALGESQWRVQFALPERGETHELLLHVAETERQRIVSCSFPLSKTVPRYRLLAHRRL